MNNLNNKHVLISGAGIAGLSLAYFLQKNGFKTTIIEKSKSLRDGGYLIDFFSSGITVINKMGLQEELAKKNRNISVIKQYSEKAKKYFITDISGFRNALKGKFFNFLRTDLVDVLYNKVKDSVDIRFSTSITTILQTDDSVTVTFNTGETESFDLLVGADGFHSNIRKLTYKSEEIEKCFLGCYIAVVEHRQAIDVDENQLYSMIKPQRQIMSYTLNTEEDKTNKITSLFVFKSDKRKYLNTEQQIECLKKEFSDFVKPTPNILNNVDRIYFDEVSQIKISTHWFKNRVVLLGDAAYCLTFLSGQGASMAITGAYVLAEKLKDSQGEYTKAYAAYENDLKPHIQMMQKNAEKNTKHFLPNTLFGIKLRNLLMPLVFTRLLSSFLIRTLGAENYFERK